MIELIALAPQTVAPNSSPVFTTVALHSGCAERHRTGSSVITLVKPGIYLVTANLDIAIPTGGTVDTISAALALDGEVLGGSEMSSSPAAAADFNNISTSHLIKVCYPCCAKITLINTSEEDVSMQNVNITVERKA